MIQWLVNCQWLGVTLSLLNLGIGSFFKLCPSVWPRVNREWAWAQAWVNPAHARSIIPVLGESVVLGFSCRGSTVSKGDAILRVSFSLYCVFTFPDPESQDMLMNVWTNHSHRLSQRTRRDLWIQGILVRQQGKVYSTRFGPSYSRVYRKLNSMKHLHYNNVSVKNGVQAEV